MIRKFIRIVLYPHSGNENKSLLQYIKTTWSTKTAEGKGHSSDTIGFSLVNNANSV